MNAVKPSFIAVLAALFSGASLAQPYDSSTGLAATSVAEGQPIASVLHKKTSPPDMMAEKVLMEPPPGSASMARPPLITKNTRTNNLSMGVSRASIFQINDLASFTVYAPTQAVNNALTFAKSVFASPLDGYVTGWIQGLSLIARRQINTELAYSVKIDRYSKLDSAIIYRTNPGTASGNSDVAASLRYSIEF